MSNSLIRNLVIARAMSVEPIARALCPDSPDFAAGPSGRPDRRPRGAAERADSASAVMAGGEAGGTTHAAARR